MSVGRAIRWEEMARGDRRVGKVVTRQGTNGEPYKLDVGLSYPLENPAPSVVARMQMTLEKADSTPPAAYAVSMTWYSSPSSVSTSTRHTGRTL